MISLGATALLLSIATPPAPPAREAEDVEYAQLVIHERVVIRVPARPGLSAPTVFREKKAARCQPMDGVGGAAVMQPDSVDILYRGGRRIRAELEEACPALDYYSGFYVLPTSDRRICAGRDAIHSRAGGECVIKRFRTLVPKKP